MQANLTTRRESAKTLLVFSVMLLLCAGFVLPAAAQSISGTVFEDKGYTGGAGRNFATAGGGVTGARVELYRAGTYYASTVTSATGAYTFTGLPNTTYTYVVRVVNSSVISNYTGGGTAGLVPVQTYRTDCSAVGGCRNGNTTGPIANYVGGQSPLNIDPAANITGAVPAKAQSITTVNIVGNGLQTPVGIDFGFNFFTVVNNSPTGQGSLAQFITNANALTGATASAIFMIYNGATTAPAGMNTTYPTTMLTTLQGGTGKGFIVNLGGGVLPAITAVNVTVDASNEVTNLGGTNPNTKSVGSNSQCGLPVTSGTTKLGTSGTTLAAWTGNTIPVVELQGCGDGAWNINGSGSTVKALAFHQCTLAVGGNSITVKDNLIGVHADGTLTTAVSGTFGISMGNGSGRDINHNYIRINNSAIRNDGRGSTGDTYEKNEITSPQTLQSTTFDGILLIGPASYSNDIVTNNYAHDLSGGGIEVGFTGSATLTNETISNNTVCSNGWNTTGDAPYAYSSPSGERVNIALWQVAQGSTVTIKNNIITNSSGVGILVENAYGFTISQNSIYLNDRSADNRGSGIALFGNCNNCDPNTFSASGYPGVTPNTGTTSQSAPNYQMNYPVMTLATYTGGNLHVKGYVGGSTNLAIANATVELFIANNTDNNQSGEIFLGDGLNVPHGEGQTFIGAFKSDSQGLFDVTIPSSSFPSGVTITVGTTLLTATATDSSTGSTSEFGPNLLVQASAITIQGYVYYDANHNGTLDSGENWKSGFTIYAVLWDTTKNLQAQLGASTIGAEAISYGSSSDTGFFSFDNVTTGDTYQLYLTSVPPGAGGIYSTKPAVFNLSPSGWINVNPNSATVNISTTASGPQIIVQSFGLFHGLTVSGKVFNDNGSGGSAVMANDGVWNGTEAGLYNVTVVAKDSTAVLLGQTSTDAGGNYTLWLPSTAVGSVNLTLSQIGSYTATGFSGGSPTACTGTACYNSLVFTFTANWTYPGYTGVNFGFIQSGNIFAPNGQQTTVPGSIAIYSHQYTSITGGTVSFCETNTNPSTCVALPQSNYFNEILYSDTTCSGKLANATYLAWGSVVTLPAGGGPVCVFIKEMVAAAASFGMQNVVTVTATFSYVGSPSALPSTKLVVTDITTLDNQSSGVLQLTKSSYIDTSCTTQACVCANPASPTYLNTTQSAVSGNCIKYQIQATNAGASALSGLILNDTVPPYTTMQAATPASSVGLTCTGLGIGAITSATATGGVQAIFTGTMPAGCVATFVYEVKIN